LLRPVPPNDVLTIVRPERGTIRTEALDLQAQFGNFQRGQRGIPAP